MMFAPSASHVPAIADLQPPPVGGAGNLPPLHNIPSSLVI